jgi:DtxR family transcriptional regulator, Mn-dependent transcriptional regulator
MSTSPSRMAEDYVTLIWKAYEWPGGEPSTTEMAASLGVTPSTVSANLKKLARDGLIEYEPYGRIALTEAGRTIAVVVVRRHRLIETYLVRRLGLSWDQVHDEADRLEHAVSDLVLAAMDEALGFPLADPHGDPIPSRDGVVAAIASWSLAEAPIGRSVVLRRVSDRDADVLRYLEAKGIGIGAVATIDARSAGAGTVSLRIDGEELELTLAAAAAIRVSAADD